MKKLPIYVAAIVICGSAALAGCQKNGVTPAKASAYKNAQVYTGPDSSGGGDKPPIPPK